MFFGSIKLSGALTNKFNFLEYFTLFPFTSLALGLVLSAMPSASAPVPSPVVLTEWNVEMGDRLVVDTRENRGYVIHTDGRFAEFPVATGQRRIVCYIGRCYNATTPERSWQVQSKVIKSNRITFGPSGRFLRLVFKGEETAYGIHEYGYEDRMFDDQPRFKSMGCIIVKKAVMDILDKTFSMNEGNIDVTTKFGVEEPVMLAFAPQDTNTESAK